MKRTHHTSGGRLALAALAAAGLGLPLLGPVACNRDPEIQQTPPTDPKTPPPYAGSTTAGGTAGQTPQKPADSGGRR